MRFLLSSEKRQRRPPRYTIDMVSPEMTLAPVPGAYNGPQNWLIEVGVNVLGFTIADARYSLNGNLILNP